MNEFLAKSDFDTVNQLLAFEKEFIKQQTMSLLKLQEQNETLTHSVMISLSKEKKIQQEIKRKKMGILYYWITISPDTSKITLEEFLKKIKNLLCKNCIASPSYAVIEQRGTIEDDNIGHGFHAHCLVKRTNFENYSSAQFIRNLKNPFRKCIDLKSPLIDNLFNVQSLVAPYTDLDGVKQDFYADKLEYIENMNKWGIEKNDKQHADVIFREKNNIKPIYQK